MNRTRGGASSHSRTQLIPRRVRWTRTMALVIFVGQMVVAQPAAAAVPSSLPATLDMLVASAPETDIPAAAIAAPAPVAVAPFVLEQLPASTDASPNCSDPPPGQKALLVGEDEIVVAARARDHNKSLQNITLDNSGNGLVSGGTFLFSSIDGLSDVRRPAITTGDLNGDGKYELISAVRDKNKRIAATTSAAGAVEWYMSGDAWDGDDVHYVDVAAGDLDRAASDDEVVVAFRDDTEDPRLIVLDGSSSGAIANKAGTYRALWHDDKGGRGNIWHVAVETGDIDGDGYDNEIVLVFKDGNKDLEALIFRLDGSALTLLWSRTWTNEGRGDVAKDNSLWGNRYPIDVTTGDLDGDLRDEVVIGFRVGDDEHGSTQLLSLHFTGQDTKNNTNPADDVFYMDDRVFLTEKLSGHYVMAAQSVSLAAGDVDGDGLDEIAFGTSILFSDSDHDERTWQQYLATYDYVPVTSPSWAASPCKDVQGNLACIRKRSGTWKSDTADVPMFVSEENVEGDVRVAVGDIDGDGFDEIALARQKHSTGSAWVYTFDDDGSLSQRTGYEIKISDDHVEEFWLGMGDKDGNARYGNYTGQCRLKKVAQVNAVIHAPPFWPNPASPNFDEAEAGFAVNVGEGGGTGKGTETSTGSSVGFGQEIGKEKWPINFGASFTYEWEKSTSVEQSTSTATVDGTKFKTHVPWAYGEEETYFDAIEFVESRYWCYDYSEAQYGTMSVCVPRPTSETTVLNYPLSWWYQEGPTAYPDSWVPVGINLAQGRAASQSSESSGGAPGRAVDGNVNGDFNLGSVSHTGYEANAWWQVDLGGVQAIDGIQIWNRSDCCASRFTNFYVFVSEDPFTTSNPATLIADPNVWHAQITGQAGRPTTVAVDGKGRYVRVELAGKDYLHMAEVQVYGRPGSVDLWPTSKPVTSTASSFVLSWPGGLQQSVPGQMLYARKGAQLGVRPASGAADFDIGMSSDGEQINESSSSSSYAFGMELKFKGGSSGEGERSWGSTDKTSYILSWSKDVEFSGAVGGLGEHEDEELSYAFMPYVWLQRASTTASINQAFMVLDFWVPEIGGDVRASSPATALATAGVAGAGVAGAGVAGAGVAGAPPLAPVVSSPSHPDANCYANNTAVFSWAQPGGDPAAISGYRWHLDRISDTEPPSVSPVLSTTFTYKDLADGLWYLHIHARDTAGQWSPQIHRPVCVDVNPPQVAWALSPAQPTGNDGWYRTPVVATVAASDPGSGVAAIEVSQDGATWQPYTGALSLSADTPGVILYARAVDVVGHTSEPVTTTLRIDQTPPNSHVGGGAGPGAWLAQTLALASGQEKVLLAGSVTDATSGRSGMDIGFDSMDWSAAHDMGAWNSLAGHPSIEVNWYYTTTNEMGAGNHIFYGRAQDQAGNLEAPYEIARIVQYPKTSPVLNGSTVGVTPLVVRPGEVVSITIVARNAGWQEALVAVDDRLPAGLVPLSGSLDANAAWDAGTATLTWSPHLLWPGESVQYRFQAQVAAGVAAGSLDHRVTLHGFWPNTDSLPPEDRQRFTDLEQTVVVTGTVRVEPALPADADVTPPWVTVSASKNSLTDSSVHLSILAAEDARWTFIREWKVDPISGTWITTQDSGWIDFIPEITLTLSAGHGVKYLGVWTKDGAGNQSMLDENSLVYSNRIDGAQGLADGGRIQYRGEMEQDTWIAAELRTLAGDPDMYIWQPYNGFGADVYVNASVSPGQSESSGGATLQNAGLYILEVKAVGDSQYEINLFGEATGGASAASPLPPKPLPAHPLTVSDPLSAGMGNLLDVDLILKYHFPVLFR